MKSFFILMMTMFSLPCLSQVTYIAHRGASHLAPENTVAATRLAWQLNADAVETDVYLTSDGRVIACHDKSTKRTSGVDYKVSETSSEVLRRLDAGSWKDSKYAGEKFPFVEELIATVPEGKTLVIEIKCGSEILPALKKAVSESGKSDQMEFICFGWETILDTKKAFPDNKCFWLSSTKDGLEEKMRLASKNGLDGVDLHHNITDKSVIDLAASLNLEVLVWTVDDPVEARRLAALGVSGITTNRPGWLREQMNHADR